MAYSQIEIQSGAGSYSAEIRSVDLSQPIGNAAFWTFMTL